MSDTPNTPEGRCAWCKKPIRRTGKRGPAPTYCTDNNGACRVAAHRARKGYSDWTAEHNLDTPEPMPHTTSPLDEQAAQAILEARAIASVSIRIGNEIHPLSWRFARLGVGINDLLDKLFGGAA